MKLRSILVGILFISNYVTAMEQNITLKDMLIEPASLVFQTAWQAVRSGKEINMEKIGAEHIVELGNKIKSVQECAYCTESEKKLFINLINNPDLSNNDIEKHFPDLISSYRKKTGGRLESKKELVNAILAEALYNNKPLLAKLAIYADADPDTKHKYSVPSLLLAAFRGYNDIIQMLIHKGANVNIQDKIGKTALMDAALNGHTAAVKILLDANADVNIADEYDGTALMLAARYNEKEIVKMLLDAGADANAKDNHGNSVLINAVEEGKAEIVKMLLDAGADIDDLYSESGRPAVMKALKKYHDIIKMLMGKGFKLKLFLLQLGITEEEMGN